MTKVSSQSPVSVFMVRPGHFGYNLQTAGSNAFQKAKLAANIDVNLAARKEFDDLAYKLKTNGISVNIFEENNPETPDAIFPNNWISFHSNGKVVLYPMMAENRRKERREDIVYGIEKKYQVSEILDLTIYEKKDMFLEGTGSIIFDYVNKIAYACRSPRTNDNLFHICCRELGYRPVLFNAKDRNGREIYHTNVMMALCDEICVICLDCIDEPERQVVREMLTDTKHEILDISFEQMERFAGNMIQLSGTPEQKFLVMSAVAYASLHKDQLDLVENFMKPLYSDLTTIETLGGGSARCMIAGIYLLPKK